MFTHFPPFYMIYLLGVRVKCFPALGIRVKCFPALGIRVKCFPALGIRGKCFPALGIRVKCFPALGIRGKCFPALGIRGKCFPALYTGYRFSRALQWLHAFPRLYPTTLFLALFTVYMSVFWLLFGSVFVLKKTSVFRFWCSLWFADFSFFSIWFSVFLKNTSGFSVLVSDVTFVMEVMYIVL